MQVGAREVGGEERERREVSGRGRGEDESADENTRASAESDNAEKQEEGVRRAGGVKAGERRERGRGVQRADSRSYPGGKGAGPRAR